MISSALVNSNAHRYREKISAAKPSTLPLALALVSPAKPPVAALPMAAISRMPKPIPVITAATRWPRSVSFSDSAESTPISISTNKNSIITAPV